VGPEGLLDLRSTPAPRFTVAGTGGQSYLFTTAPEVLRAVRLVGRRERALPLDAALSPAARVEVQAVWEHLAAQCSRPEGVPALPRRAEWFLIARGGVRR